jgi:cupin fold WbuC family metalloprotein
MLLPIHRDQEALVQRMVNFLQPGTYIQPHQHPREWATETILVMEGELGFLVFDNSGAVISVHRLRAGEMIDIEARVWHGVLALAPDTIVLEIKRGPYDDSDKVFAEWAPPEGDEGCPSYRSRLESLFPASSQS